MTFAQLIDHVDSDTIRERVRKGGCKEVVKGNYLQPAICNLHPSVLRDTLGVVAELLSALSTNMAARTEAAQSPARSRPLSHALSSDTASTTTAAAAATASVGGGAPANRHSPRPSNSVNVTENPMASSPAQNRHDDPAAATAPPTPLPASASVAAAATNPATSPTKTPSNLTGPDSGKANPTTDANRPDVTQCDQGKTDTPSVPVSSPPNSDPPPPYQVASLASGKVTCPLHGTIEIIFGYKKSPSGTH
ncbi:mucin-1-like [Penaeus chinensis]|uniref:mucin-1-like n=1 Tax=Penaeus chinensis TaxID=139456 RepID=UPI001FB7DA03|nr:mucin-1-like [Penaeus chinensis]